MTDHDGPDDLFFGNDLTDPDLFPDEIDPAGWADDAPPGDELFADDAPRDYDLGDGD